MNFVPFVVQDPVPRIKGETTKGTKFTKRDSTPRQVQADRDDFAEGPDGGHILHCELFQGWKDVAQSSERTPSGKSTQRLTVALPDRRHPRDPLFYTSNLAPPGALQPRETIHNSRRDPYRLPADDDAPILRRRGVAVKETVSATSPLRVTAPLRGNLRSVDEQGNYSRRGAVTQSRERDSQILHLRLSASICGYFSGITGTRIMKRKDAKAQSREG